MNLEQKRIIIIEYYKKELQIKEISEKVGVPTQTIHNFVKQAKIKGIIKNVPRVQLEPNEVDKALDMLPSNKVIVNKVGVNCTPSVSRTCIYGLNSNSNFYCNFFSCTGMLRTSKGFKSEKPSNCHCYQKITRDNPRREGKAI